MTNYIESSTGLWEVVIGLEVHAQVTSTSKLFSGASTSFGAEPNTQVAFLDAGMPGMLPTLNQYCVDQAIKTGLGFGGRVNNISAFDRKNYFYPDLPTGYQLTQLYHPIVTGGTISIDLEDGTTKSIRIHHMHLEQDAGKSTHDLSPDKSYIDLNRAGIALMEIVTEPDMRSRQEAEAFLKKLHSLLRYMGTCDGNMDQGSFRADINVSIHRPDEPFGTRAEVKNLNSFRYLNQAVEYEVYRQMDIIENGGTVQQETRLFDPSTGETRSLRTKENANDYRYFPCPDLLPLVITDERIERVAKTLPELPDAKKARFMQEYGLPAYDASVLVADQDTAGWYDAAVKKSKSEDKMQAAKLIANWLMGDVFAAMNKDSMKIDTLKISQEHLAEMIDLIIDETISGKIAKEVFAKMWETGKSPSTLVDELGLKQITDTGAIEAVIDRVIAAHPKHLEDYRSGKDKLFGFFVGQVMKEMQGKGNPAIINEILKKKLER